MARKGSFSYGVRDGQVQAGLRPQILWEGEWSTGTIDVPNVRGYTMFLIYMKGRASLIPAFYNKVDDEEHISGIGGRASSSTTEYQYSFACTMSEETLTMVHCHSHQGAGNRSTQTVSRIVGVF